jgi:hypothetical protein
MKPEVIVSMDQCGAKGGYLDRADEWHLEVECHHLVEAFGQQARQVAVSRTDVQAQPAANGYQFEKAGNALDFPWILAIGIEVNGHGQHSFEKTGAK